MGTITTTYDGPQHCTAVRAKTGPTVATDCPYTGKGAELSPTNLVQAALGGCILISMGTLAMRHDIDLVGTRIDVDIATTDQPVMRFLSIDVSVDMPAGLSASDRTKLEKAADSCPIKHSFAADIPLRVAFRYPD